MTQLTVHFKIKGMSFGRFLEIIPIFRSGIKRLLPPVAVCIYISPEGVIDGDIVCKNIPLDHVEGVLNQLTGYFHQTLPDVRTNFSYVDWEDRS